jgi:hypothetical protein
MVSEPGILVLVERGPVETPQAEFVLGEMRRHPVENHADSPSVELVDHEAEIVGTAIARGWSEVATDLVAPRASERVLHQREKLHVGETHLLHIFSKLHRQLSIREAAVPFFWHAAPRARMHLVNRYGSLYRVATAARRHPGFVAKLIVRAVYDRSGGWRGLHLPRKGITLKQ